MLDEPIREGRFPVVDMSDDAEVSNILNHGLSPLPRQESPPHLRDRAGNGSVGEEGHFVNPRSWLPAAEKVTGDTRGIVNTRGAFLRLDNVARYHFEAQEAAVMISRREIATIVATLVLSIPQFASAQATTSGGTLLVHSADGEALGNVADSPNAREALAPREAPGPMINPGTVFQHGHYRGVVPGQSHVPPRARRLKRTRRNFVTWPGFEMHEGASRVFVQSTSPVTYTRSNESGRIVIVLQNTRINLRNNRNPLVTEHFNTPVAEAYLRQRRRDTLLVLEMKVDASARIRQMSENGYHFLFVEFNAGNYPVPDGVRRGYRYSERSRQERSRRKAEKSFEI